jgi:very-short-patch-repair endonuclease
MSGRPLERILDEADRHHLLDPSAFNELLRVGRCPRSLRSLLESHDIGATLTRSDLEELFLKLCRDHALPKPLVNAELLGLTVDFLWPGSALVVEVDARGTHGTDRAFQDDRDRDSMLVASGFRVMRFTHWDLLRREGLVAHRIRRSLDS